MWVHLKFSIYSLQPLFENFKKKLDLKIFLVGFIIKGLCSVDARYNICQECSIRNFTQLT